MQVTSTTPTWLEHWDVVIGLLGIMGLLIMALAKALYGATKKYVSEGFAGLHKKMDQTILRLEKQAEKNDVDHTEFRERITRVETAAGIEAPSVRFGRRADDQLPQAVAAEPGGD